MLYKAGLNLENGEQYSSAETVQPGAQILANTNGGALTLTLPASPVIGDDGKFCN
jgi:hypothetical protein